MFDKLIELDFEDKKFLSTQKYDEVLKICYDDYMMLPAEEDRVWKHHPLLIDLNHNYEDLIIE